jgi:type VI secretion system protein ImpH
VLFEEGFRFEFFQAVRLLERISPRQRAVGRDAKPEHEVARFRSQSSLSFPASDVHEIARPVDGDGPAGVTVTFMGLAGLSGPLPRHYTDLINERLRQKDAALRDFLDLFNHRLISLFFRAWEKYRLPIGYERAAWRREGRDPLSLALFDLMGMGTDGLRGRLGVEDEILLYSSGLVAQRPRSAGALEGILTAYFDVSVRAIQFVGQWLPIAEEDRSCLGVGGPNSALGVNAVLGRRVWDQQAKFVLRMGPLGYGTFCDLLPSGTAFAPLVRLTWFLAGQECDFDVQLVLRAAEVPRCRLGETGPTAPRLGWSTWLKTRAFARDADETVLTGGLTACKAFPG